MSKNKKSKKEKRVQKQLEKVQTNEIVYDIIQLLKENKLDTKPNMAKFLQNYVKNIRVIISNGKAECWPEFKYQISKIFVTFLDGHELLFFTTQELPNNPKHYMYYNTEEIALKQKDVQMVDEFFNSLVKFKFVPENKNDPELFANHQPQSSFSSIQDSSQVGIQD